MSTQVHLLTVDELVGLLSALPPEQRAMPAKVEGCDCDGPAIGLYVGDGTITITRGEQVWDDDLDEMVWVEQS
jgi:hypothetical protein